MNTLNTTELYLLNGQNLWYINYILIKLLKNCIYGPCSQGVDSLELENMPWDMTLALWLHLPIWGKLTKPHKECLQDFLLYHQFQFGERIDYISSILKTARIVLKTKTRHTYYISLIFMFTSFSLSKASCFSSSRFISNASVSALLDSEESLTWRSWTFYRKQK